MSNEIAATEQRNPFGDSTAVATRPANGALAEANTQRGVAEVQARMMIARANPRDPVRCMDLILQDCMRPTLAEGAVYQYSRGGSDIEGPSIRLAEAVARRWGNIASGIKEVARGPGYSECIAYAWDLEAGYYDERQFQVRHWRDTKKGGYALTDERDIYELVANMGQRRKRAVLLSVIPGDVVDAAVEECGRTLKAKADTSPEGLKKLVAAFEGFGVSREQIEQRIQRRLDAITPAQVVGLKKVYASLRDGMSAPGDWFEAAEQQPQASAAGEAQQPAASATESLKERVRKRTERVDPTTGEIRDERGDSAAKVEQERAGPPPSSEAPTFEDAVRLVKETDYEAALDIARALGGEDEKKIRTMVTNHKKGADTPA